MIVGWVSAFLLLWGASVWTKGQEDCIFGLLDIWAAISLLGLIYASVLVVQASISQKSQNQVWCSLGINLLSWLICLIFGTFLVGTRY